MSIGTRQIEVLGRAATVYGMNGYRRAVGVLCARAGDRFRLGMRNDTDFGIITHWHGQVMAAEGQDRSYTGGGALAPGGVDQMDFELTPGTHWMHAHQLIGTDADGRADDLPRDRCGGYSRACDHAA